MTNTKTSAPAAKQGAGTSNQKSGSNASASGSANKGTQSTQQKDAVSAKKGNM